MMNDGHNGRMLMLLSEERMITVVDEYRDGIRRAFDALPEGIWAELVDGEIIVSPFPSDQHQVIVRYLVRLLAVGSPEAWEIEPAGGLIIKPGLHEYRPDIYVAPSDAWRRDPPGADPERVELVVEVVSPTKRDRERDRETKFRVYAAAGIPLYLLVDRYEGKGFTTLYSNPSGDRYLDTHGVPFGEKLTLPKPFDVEIDTARF